MSWKPVVSRRVAPSKTARIEKVYPDGVLRRSTMILVSEETRVFQRWLGASLRQLFDDAMSEPAATEFLEILSQADDGERDGAVQAPGRPGPFEPGDDGQGDPGETAPD